MRYFLKILIISAALMSQAPQGVLAQTIIESSTTSDEKLKVEEALHFNSDPQNFLSSRDFFQELSHSLKSGIKIILGPQFILKDNVSFEAEDESTEPSRTFSTVTKAMNLGLHLWAQRVAQHLRTVFLTIDGSPIEIKGPQAGIIFLAGSFFEDDSRSQFLSTMNRARYLSHESKHSDCSAVNKCGRLHIACDSSSPLFPRQVCDADMSGPIGLDIQYMTNILKTFSHRLTAYEREKILLDMSFSKSLIVGRIKAE